jgi:hypothetical protein
MSSAVHHAQTLPADPATVAASAQVPVASPAMAAAGRVSRAGTGAPDFAVGAAALLFALPVVFMLFAVLLILML